MSLPRHALEWMEQAEIDYIGPFVKAWAAFNAWYRHTSEETQERAMLRYATHNQNSKLRRHVLPLLTNDNGTTEAERLKLAICDLQHALDAIHFEVTSKGRRERISLREVCIQTYQLQHRNHVKNGVQYVAKKTQGGSIEISVTSTRTGRTKFLYVQPMYDTTEVYSQPEFHNLTSNQRTTLRQFYDNCNPRPMTDLFHANGPALDISTIRFHCTSEDLLVGLIETLYSMRNALLHGEVDPDEQVLSCYEPAYRVVMCFLEAIR